MVNAEDLDILRQSNVRILDCYLHTLSKPAKIGPFTVHRVGQSTVCFDVSTEKMNELKIGKMVEIGENSTKQFELDDEPIEDECSEEEVEASKLMRV